MKRAHLMYMPLTGLGLYGGHRGNRWLRNRITVFKQFVLPSLLAQRNQDFILWVSVRYEDRGDALIEDFRQFLESQFNRQQGENRVVFTYSGVCFWDDKHDDEIAYERLVNAIHGAVPDLLNAVGEVDEILMTIQPSDDCYWNLAIDEIHNEFDADPTLQVFGYKSGFVMDYATTQLKEWNPKTTPPFYTIRFPREIFIDAMKHIKYTGPYKSHEYVKDYLKAKYIDGRGFLVGTHGENISTVFDHPYAGVEYTGNAKNYVLAHFGLKGVERLKLPFSLRRRAFNRLPYAVKRKLRFWAGDKKWVLRPLFSAIYTFLRA